MNKQEIITYLDKTEMEVARAKAAFFVCDLVYGSYADSKVVHGEDFSPTFCHFAGHDEGSFHQIIAKKIIADIGARIYNDYLESPESLEKKIVKHVALERELDNLWQEYITLKSTSTTRSLTPFFKKFCDVSVRWWYYGAIGEDHGAVIHDLIVPKFAKRHGLALSEADSIFNQLSHPEEKTILNTEREEFLGICLDIAEGKDATRDINGYIKKYFWFKSDFYQATQITPERLRSEAKSHIEASRVDGIQKEAKEIDENFKRLHEEREKLLARIELSAEDEKDLHFAARDIQWIDFRKIGMMKDFYYLLNIINDAAEREGMKREKIVLYALDELMRFFETGERVPDELLHERGKGCFLAYRTDEKRSEYYGCDSEELFKTATRFKHEGDLKGQVASRGGVKMVSGKARIIHHPTKEVFNDGEILVTSMTRIEFVPLMRKAKAIITDEGGIACHAAIVSREMGLPCIIGTRNATRILKDGDAVEMNMENGIVRIINSDDEK